MLLIGGGISEVGTGTDGVVGTTTVAGGVDGINVEPRTGFVVLPTGVGEATGGSVGVSVGTTGGSVILSVGSIGGRESTLESMLPSGIELVGTEGGGAVVVTGTTVGALPGSVPDGDGAGVDSGTVGAGGSVAVDGVTSVVVPGSSVDRMLGISLVRMDGRTVSTMEGTTLVITEPRSLVTDPIIGGRITSAVVVVAAAEVTGAGSVEPPTPVKVTPKGVSVSGVVAGASLGLVVVEVRTPPGPNVIADSTLDVVVAAAGVSNVDVAADGVSIVEVAAVGKTITDGASPVEAAEPASDVGAGSDASGVELGLAVGRMMTGGTSPVEAAEEGSVVVAAELELSVNDNEVSNPSVEAADEGSEDTESLGLAVGSMMMGGISPVEAAELPTAVLEAAKPASDVFAITASLPEVV
jgi:hypothetical protein